MNRIIALAVILGLFALSCAPTASPTSAPTQPPAGAPTKAPSTPTPLAPIPIRIAVGIDPTYGAYYIADKQGIFKKYGLDATVTKFEGGAAMINAVVAGQQDVAANSQPTGIIPIDKGADYYIAAFSVECPGYVKIVVRSNISGAQDLRGKNIGVFKGTLSEYIWDKFFEKYGMTENDVKMINVAAPETVALMDRGDIDAFALWEPFPTRAVQTMGDKVKILTSAEDQGLYYCRHILQIRKGYADSNPEGVKRLLRALKETNDWVASNRSQAVQLIATEMKLNPKDVESFFASGLNYRLSLNDSELTEMDSIAKWMVDKKLIKAVPDWKKHFRPEFLKEVLPDAVNVTKL